jgi:hypothetical protein
MRRLIPSSSVVFLALLGARAFAAEETAPVASADAAATTRAVSPAMAERLTAAAPKFAAATGQPAEPPQKPRNTIVHLPVYLLPTYRVEERRLPTFKEREMLTPQGKIELAYKKHPGLFFNPLFFLSSNRGIALFMEEEDERLERMAEFKDLVRLINLTDKTAGAAAQREMNQTFIRSSGP